MHRHRHTLTHTCAHIPAHKHTKPKGAPCDRPQVPGVITQPGEHLLGASCPEEEASSTEGLSAHEGGCGWDGPTGCSGLPGSWWTFQVWVLSRTPQPSKENTPWGHPVCSLSASIFSTE